MSADRYPQESLSNDDDDGTMPASVAELAHAVVGHRIVKAEWGDSTSNRYWTYGQALILTLDDGRRVEIANTSDCCAYTALESFLLNPAAVDHVITGVGTTDGYTTWHVYADMGDVLKLDVQWSPGNPFYYGYGFSITVKAVSE